MLGVSTGRVCAPTRNQPDDIGFPARQPAADRRNQWVKSDRIEISAVGSVEVDEVLPKVAFGRRSVFFVGSSPDLCETN